MNTIKMNLEKLLKGYKSGWVGIAEDFSSVIVSGRNLKETRKKASKIKEKIYFFPAGETYSNYIG